MSTERAVLSRRRCGTNLCPPSEALSRWERRTIRKHVTTT